MPGTYGGGGEDILIWSDDQPAVDAANLAVGVENLADAGTITWADEDPTRPAINLQLGEMGATTRTISYDADPLVLELDAPRVLSQFAIALPGCNLASADQASLAIFDSAIDLSIPVQTFQVGCYGWFDKPYDGRHRNMPLFYYDGDPIEIKRVEWTFVFAGADPPYIQLSRYLFLPLFVPVVGFSYGWSQGWVDPSEVDDVPGGGNMISHRRRKRRNGTFGLEWLDQEEAWDGFFKGVDAEVGLTKDFLVVPFPPTSFPDIADDLQLRLIWGTQVDLGGISNPVFERFAKQFSVRERT